MPDEPRPLRIFMSYRRADTRGYAGWLSYSLAPRFGEANIFRDVTTLQGGVEFMHEIDKAISHSDVVLCLIGSRWLDMPDDQGRRRLENADDPVRIEVGTALAKKKPLIPVLFEGVQMPKPPDLPDDLAPMCRLTARWMDDGGWDADLATLVKNIDAARPNEELLGSTIVERFTAGRASPNWVGRNGGRNGSIFRGDVQSGGWRQQKYQVSYRLNIPNLRNWMSVDDFVTDVSTDSVP